jgi:hypothetical protein
VSEPLRGGVHGAVQKLAGPDPANADRILLVDLPVLGPIPYRGGNITVGLGLFAVQSSDLAEPFLDLLGTISRAAGVSFVDAAKPFIGPLKIGAERLLGMRNQSSLAVGLERGYSAVNTGTFLVTDAPANLVDIRKIKLDDSFRISFAPNDKLAGYPYFVFSIEADTRRADWASIPELRGAHEAIRTLLRNPKTTENKAEEAFAVFKRLAENSPDLIDADAEALVAAKNEKLERAFGRIRAVAGRKKGLDIGSFDKLDLYGKR